jgi:hypothetical protein
VADDLELGQPQPVFGHLHCPVIDTANIDYDYDPLNNPPPPEEEPKEDGPARDEFLWNQNLQAIRHSWKFSQECENIELSYAYAKTAYKVAVEENMLEVYAELAGTTEPPRRMTSNHVAEYLATQGGANSEGAEQIEESDDESELREVDDCEEEEEEEEEVNGGFANWHSNGFPNEIPKDDSEDEEAPPKPQATSTAASLRPKPQATPCTCGAMVTHYRSTHRACFFNKKNIAAASMKAKAQATSQPHPEAQATNPISAASQPPATAVKDPETTMPPSPPKQAPSQPEAQATTQPEAQASLSQKPKLCLSHLLKCLPA